MAALAGFAVLFVLVPFLLGYGTGWYAIAILPAASVVASAIAVALTPSPHRDEIDVLPQVWLGASVIAVACCLAGAALARLHRRP